VSGPTKLGSVSERIDADQFALGLEDVETDIARAEAAKPRTKPKDVSRGASRL
jgi:hypothetical protein